MVSRKLTIRKFKILHFRNGRLHGAGNLQKDFYLGHLQPPIDKNSKHLFDDVTVTNNLFLTAGVVVVSTITSDMGRIL